MVVPEPTAAYIQHAIPGRLRIKVPAGRGDDSYFSSIAETLSQTDGVRRGEVNARTASVLIEYDVGEPDDAARLAALREKFGISDLLFGAPPVWDEVRKRSKTAQREVEGVLGRAGLDLVSSIFLTLVALSLVQLARGRVLAPAVTLLWYAAATLLIRKSSPKA